MSTSKIQPYTAALTWRCRISTAANGYAHFLAETDPITLKVWSDIYKTGDIKQWATKCVNSMLAECAILWQMFANDAQLVEFAQSAALRSLESLGHLGWSGVVPIRNVRGDVDAVIEYGEMPML